jgi:hypothetical protein
VEYATSVEKSPPPTAKTGTLTGTFRRTFAGSD